jgi:hypothetical protein
MRHSVRIVASSCHFALLAALGACAPPAVDPDAGPAKSEGWDGGPDDDRRRWEHTEPDPRPDAAILDADDDARVADGGPAVPDAGATCDPEACALAACDDKPCGPGGRVCADGTCACPTGDRETSCDDGSDNDCDGEIDCADPDCDGRSCGGSGRVCSAETARCVCGASTETCNGRDDDCDGVVDDGCPASARLCCASYQSPIGGGGGTSFTRACPSGSVVAAVRGRSGDRVDQLTLRCHPASFSRTLVSGQYRYRLVTGTGGSLSPVGGSGGTAFADACRDDEMVVGIEGRAGAEIDQIAFVCARITFERRRGAYQRIRTVTGTTVARGGLGGDTFRVMCPARGVVTGVRGRAGERIDQLALRCSEVALAIQ